MVVKTMDGKEFGLPDSTIYFDSRRKASHQAESGEGMTIGVVVSKGGKVILTVGTSLDGYVPPVNSIQTGKETLYLYMPDAEPDLSAVLKAMRKKMNEQGDSGVTEEVKQKRKAWEEEPISGLGDLQSFLDEGAADIIAEQLPMSLLNPLKSHPSQVSTTRVGGRSRRR